jgi:hypothetical protein
MVRIPNVRTAEETYANSYAKINDKFQGITSNASTNHLFVLRTTGPINPTTGQPIKGRKKGGGT